jgi:Mn2+/Fe2+ NRAMP family transporter
MSLAFITYLITGFFSGANWGQALQNTFLPHLDFSFSSISSAVGLLGATISPYTMFWQVQGEKEEHRQGSENQQIKTAALDIGRGVISGQLVAYFIIICTSATLFTHHAQITSAADAAKALAPLVGDFAKYLFATGLLGAGLIAIPVLLASASYALAGTFKLPASLSKKPWQNEGFYLILTAALTASLIVAVLGFDPIQLMFWANVLQGTLSPILLVFIIIVGNNHKIMGNYKLHKGLTIGLLITTLLLFVGTGLLLFGLLSGQTK